MKLAKIKLRVMRRLRAFVEKLSDSEIQDRINAPLSDVELLGAYKVLSYPNPDASEAKTIIGRRDVPVRVPHWCFLNVMENSRHSIIMNNESILEYTKPFPVKLTAGADVEFSATVFGFINDFWNTDPIRLTSRYESAEQEIFKQIISKGDVVFDIGANIGIHTALFSFLVGDEGRVMAFEPIDLIFERLQAMVNFNGLKNVFIYNVAAGDSCTETFVPFSPINIGGTTLSDSKSEEGTGKKVKVVRLDSFFPSEAVQRLDFIKIDVEGYEYFALKGMEALLYKFKPKLFLEFGIGMISHSGVEPIAFAEWLFSIYTSAHCVNETTIFTEARSLIDYLESVGGFKNILFYS